MIKFKSMDLKAKETALLALGVSAVTCSRVMFALFNDPEGPNLLVVGVMAAFIYLVALAIYLFNPIVKGSIIDLSLASSIGRRSVLKVLVIQLLTTGVLYFCLV